MAKRFTLSKSERLKSRKQIEQLFKDGKKLSVSPLHIYYLVRQLTTHDSPKVRKDSFGEPSRTPFTTQFGVGVSAKNFKRAVDRNRIKRLIRESYRLQKPDFAKGVKANNQQLNLFFIYTGKELPDYGLIYNKVAIALLKISREIEKQSAT